jgi:hypothetical protein
MVSGVAASARVLAETSRLRFWAFYAASWAVFYPVCCVRRE